MTRPRDQQRKRLYDAEAVLKSWDPTLLALDEVRELAERVVRSRWWRTRRPLCREVVVHDGRARRRAGGWLVHQYWPHEEPHEREIAHIAMPRWSRTRGIVLHELAHALTPNGYAAHGPEFAKNMLQMVRRFMGKEAAALLAASYKAHGVRFRVKGRPVV